MTKRKLFLLILIFLVYEVLVWLGSLFFLADSAVLVGFVLTVCGITILLVYLLVAKLSRAAQAPADAAAAEVAKPTPNPAPAGPSPVSALIQEANERLAKSPTLASQRVKSTITDFPLYFVLGGEGSGKTSLFLASKFEPEVLAGQVYRDSAVVPTRLANIWFADSAVIVEGAGDFFSGENSRWKDFLSAFHRPGGNSRFAKVFGAGQESRLSGVLLCCDATAFVGVPDTARLAAISRLAQLRLRAIGEVFGRDFPVYVIFTKSDAIPYFAQYVGRLTEAEDSQVLGCAFPGVAPGQSPDAETVNAGLNRLYLSLADKRLEFLEREKDSTRRPAVYEFPREFKRLRGQLGQFLQEVFRTNPLQPNPLLLGVYFTGTRRVAGQAADHDRSAIHKVGDVTRILRTEDLHRLRTPLADTPEREPEITRWSFVSDLWQQILHRRQGAGAGLFINRRQQQYRKIAYMSAAGVLALAGFLFIYSFLQNYRFASEVRTAASNCKALPQGGVPSLRDLQEIDELREKVEILTEGKPGIFRHFGFYPGSTLLDPTRHVYFTRFREYFLNAVVRQLDGDLSGLPSAQSPSYPYSDVYSSLKTYRTITKSSEPSCPPDAALVGRLMATWTNNRPLDAESARIAGENFRFYASSLKSDREIVELHIPSNDQVVQRARTYLSAFRGAEREYQQIIDQVNQEKKADRLADLNSKYASVLRVDQEVPAAFTLAGWPRVQELINNAAGGTGRDSCVLGGGSGVASFLPDGDLKVQLQNRYIQEYVQRWRSFLASSSVLPYGGCGDAAAKLDILKENNSPILAVLLLTAENTTGFPKRGASLTQQAATAVKKADRAFEIFGRSRDKSSAASKVLGNVAATGLSEDEIAKDFQPAREVFDKGTPNRARWADPRNTPYLDSLAALVRPLKDLDVGGKCDEGNQALNNEVNAGLAQAQKIIDGLARNFDNRGVYDNVKTLLESPLVEGRKLIPRNSGDVTRRKIEGAKQQLCSELGALRSKFPFSSQARENAPLPAVNKVFDPKDGLLANLLQAIGDSAVRSGGTWSQKPDAPVKLSREFLAFLTRMSAISDALFPPPGGGPGMKYKLSVQQSRAIKEVTGTIDGEPISGTKEYAWPPSSGAIDLRVTPSDGGSTPLRSYSGPWAIFRLLLGADEHRAGTNQFSLLYVIGEGAGSIRQPILADRSPIVFVVTQFPNNVAQAFDKSFYEVACPKQIFE